MIELEIEQKFAKIVKFLAKTQGATLDLQSIIFLVGARELGISAGKFSKDQKVDLMHIAICRLLAPYGFYELDGQDQDGWPHYKQTDKLPKLEPKEQERLLKEALISYFETEGVI